MLVKENESISLTRKYDIDQNAERNKIVNKIKKDLYKE